MIRSIVGPAAALSILLWQMGCCPTPSAVIATGTKGAYARFLPANGAQPAQARAGLIDAPEHWPPASVAEDCKADVDEVKQLETSLGISLSPTLCPQIQAAAVPVTGAPAPTGAPARKLGFLPYCYEMGGLVLVVEATESMTDNCKHIVGLAVFKKGTSP